MTFTMMGSGKDERGGQDRRRPRRAWRPGVGMGVERFEERALLSVALVSVSAGGQVGGDGSSSLAPPTPGPGGAPSSAQAVSADGHRVVFESVANDLAGVQGASGQPEIYVRDLAGGTTIPVSVAPDGTTAGNGASIDPILSPDGRYVAFLSTATNLTGTAPATPGMHLYVRDLTTGTTTLLDTTAAGQGSDGQALPGFVFSPDGKTLAFVDTSTNLTGTAAPAATSAAGTAYVYARNLAAGTTSLVSATPTGQRSVGDPAGVQPGNLTFSPDGTRLAFTSAATDLTTSTPDASTPASGTPAVNLFVRDLTAGTTTLVSATGAGNLSNGQASGVVFSPDGQHVAFISTATDLVPGVTQNTTGQPASSVNNLFVRNLANGTTALVSATTAGDPAGGITTPGVFSPNGALLAFTSTAGDLTAATGAVGAGGTNAYVYNVANGSNLLVSATPAGTLSNGTVNDLAFSPDGTKLAFVSTAADLTANPASAAGSSNVFVRDLNARTTSLVSVTTIGTLAPGWSTGPVFSPDGSKVAFTSTSNVLTSNPPDPAASPVTADKLLPGQPTVVVPSNVFVRDLAAGQTSLVTTTPAGLAGNGSVAGPVAFMPDGGSLLFTSTASDLAPGSPAGTNVFKADVPAAAPNQISFATWQYAANESQSGVTITVNRAGPATTPAVVRFATADGTAKAGTDYAGTTGVLNFAPGVTSQTFSIPLAPGDRFPGARTVQLSLSNPIGATVGYPNATLTLTGDPTPLPVTPPIPTPTPGVPTPPPAPSPRGGSPSTPVIIPVYVAPTPTPTPTPMPTPTLPTPVPAGTIATPVTSTGTTSPTATPTTTPTTPTTPASSTTPATNPAPTAATSAGVAVGPTVAAVSEQAVRRRVTGLVLSFSTDLAPVTAGNTANYLVSIPRPSRNRRVPPPSRLVPVTSATYDPISRTVALGLRPGWLRVGQKYQLVVNAAPGGLTNLVGQPLNSPGPGLPGSNFTALLG